MLVAPIVFGLLCLAVMGIATYSWFGKFKLKRALNNGGEDQWRRLAPLCSVSLKDANNHVWVNGSIGNGYTSISGTDIAVLVTDICIVFVYCGYFRYHPFIVTREQFPKFVRNDLPIGTILRERRLGISIRNVGTMGALIENLLAQGWHVGARKDLMVLSRRGEENCCKNLSRMIGAILASSQYCTDEGLAMQEYWGVMERVPC
jgi:hypothetical protein